MKKKLDNFKTMKRETRTKGLPSGFKLLEYIESTGTQYIDTNLEIPVNESDFFAITASCMVRDAASVFGWSDSNNYNDINMNHSGRNYKCEIAWCHTAAYTPYATELDTMYKMEMMGNGECLVNGEHIGTVSKTVDNRDLCYILGRKVNDSYYGCSCRLYEFQYGSNDKFLRDMVPVLRLSDNKPGLYDLCESTCPLTNTPFYINSGTGEFLYN